MSQLAAWYDDYGLPVIALCDYGSQTIADLVRRDTEADGRPAVLLADLHAPVRRDQAPERSSFVRLSRLFVLVGCQANPRLPPMRLRSMPMRNPPRLV